MRLPQRPIPDNPEPRSKTDPGSGVLTAPPFAANPVLKAPPATVQGDVQAKPWTATRAPCELAVKTLDALDQVVLPVALIVKTSWLAAQGYPQLSLILKLKAPNPSIFPDPPLEKVPLKPDKKVGVMVPRLNVPATFTPAASLPIKKVVPFVVSEVNVIVAAVPLVRFISAVA